MKVLTIITSDLIADFLTQPFPKNTLQRFPKLVVMLSLLVGSLITTTARANSSIYHGGFVVIVQGLASNDIAVAFGEQKQSSNKGTSNKGSYTVSILADDGSLVYSQAFTTDSVDLSSLSLPVGDYCLCVAVDGNVEMVFFGVD